MKQANNQGVDNLAIRLMYLVGSEDFFSFPPRSANCQLFFPSLHFLTIVKCGLLQLVTVTISVEVDDREGSQVESGTGVNWRQLGSEVNNIDRRGCMGCTRVRLKFGTACDRGRKRVRRGRGRQED